MDFEYTVTTSQSRVVRELTATDALLNGEFVGDKLVTHSPIENKLVDMLRLVPQDNAANYYSLHYLRNNDWLYNNPNGFENTEVSTIKLEGGLEELAKIDVAPQRFSVSTQTFQDFIDNNQDLTVVVDYSKKIAQSECWTPQALEKNPLAPKFELSNTALEKWPGVKEALGNLNVPLNEIANPIRSGGYSSIHVLEDNVAMKLAFQYSQGKAIEIPSKSFDGTPFLNNAHFTSLTDDYIKFQNAAKRSGALVTFEEFKTSMGDKLVKRIDQAINYQINQIMVKEGIENNLDDNQEYIDGLATKLYEKLNPSNVLMGLEYHIKQVQAAYEKEFVPDLPAVEMQLNLLMADKNQEQEYQKWIVKQLQNTLHNPKTYILGKEGKQPLKSKEGNAIFNQELVGAQGPVSADTMVAALVQISNQSPEKITAEIESDITAPSNHVSQAYADLINDFTKSAIELSDLQDVDIEDTKQTLFLEISKLLSDPDSKLDHLGQFEHQEQIRSLADRFVKCPVPTPNTDPTQTLSLHDIKAIVVPDVPQENQKLDQILAIERLKEKGFKGDVEVFEPTEQGTKAECINTLLKTHEGISKLQGTAIENTHEPHLTEKDASRILDAIQSQNPYLQITAHSSAQTMPSTMLGVDMQDVAGLAKDGVMHINLSHGLNQTENSLRSVVAHESVHLGLRKMMNVAEHATLMESVWETIPETERQEISDKYDFYNAEKPHDRRALAEEWLANRAQSLHENVTPLIHETIRSKVQTFQNKVLAGFKRKNDISRFDNVIQQAIQKAGAYNEIVDGSLVYGIHKKNIRTFAYNNTSKDPLREFHEGQRNGEGHNASVQLATKKDFIYKYERNGQASYIAINFKNTQEPSIEGSTLSLPTNYSLDKCLQVLNDTISKSFDVETRNNVSSPKEVKEKLGNIEQQVKQAHAPSSYEMASIFSPKKTSEPEVKTNNIDNGVDFISR